MRQTKGYKEFRTEMRFHQGKEKKRTSSHLCKYPKSAMEIVLKVIQLRKHSQALPTFISANPPPTHTYFYSVRLNCLFLSLQNTDLILPLLCLKGLIFLEIQIKLIGPGGNLPPLLPYPSKSLIYLPAPLSSMLPGLLTCKSLTASHLVANVTMLVSFLSSLRGTFNTQFQPNLLPSFTGQNPTPALSSLWYRVCHCTHQPF